MLTNLIGTYNYRSYNIKIAQLFGLNVAVYLSELININNKAIAKNKIENGYFKINRKYITDVTTLTSKEQIEIEDKLSQISILNINPDNKDLIKVNISALTSIMSSNEEKAIEKISSLVKAPPKEKRTKRQVIADNLKHYIVCNNEELLEAYNGWIDGVYANPTGFLSKRSIEIFQKTLDEYTKGDLDVALDILDIATVNGHRDVSWSIEAYEKSGKKRRNISTRPTKAFGEGSKIY